MFFYNAWEVLYSTTSQNLGKKLKSINQSLLTLEYQTAQISTSSGQSFFKKIQYQLISLKSKQFCWFFSIMHHVKVIAKS